MDQIFSTNLKFDRICRLCLIEKVGLKPLFEACVADMLMSCASIVVSCDYILRLL